MEKLNLSEIASFIGSTISGADTEIASVSTDTRTIEAGSLFIPLRGERFDGHRFIEEAIIKGASAVLTEKPLEDARVPYILVPDTGEALMKLAERYKERYRLKTVGITGSVGKTTTKEMTASVLGESYKTLKTEGNLNNFVGLPLTVLRLDRTFEAAVLEMGMSSFGEISRLTQIAKPDAAVITTIGVSHIEYLGSREGILQAKLEILEGLKPDGVAILNGDEPLLYALKGTLPVKTVYFGRQNTECDVFARDISDIPGGLEFTADTSDLSIQTRLNVVGHHNVSDALAAIACGLHFGLSERKIQDGLLRFQNVGMRQNIYPKGGCTIIEDCYNASPDSMLAAFQVLKSIKTQGRKFCVLGGMKELGNYSQRGHLECGASASGVSDYLFVFGEDAEFYATGAKNAGMDPSRIECFQTKEELAEALKKTVSPGDVLLIKGSRAMKMEEVPQLVFGEKKNEV